MSRSLEQWRPRRWFPLQLGARIRLCLVLTILGVIAGAGVGAGMLTPSGATTANARGEVLFASQGLESPDAVRARAIETLREQGVAAQIPSETPARADAPPALITMGPPDPLAARLKAAGLNVRSASPTTARSMRYLGLGAGLTALMAAWLAAWLLGRRLASTALAAERDRLSLLVQAGAEPETLQRALVGRLARYGLLAGALGVAVGEAAAIAALRRGLNVGDVLQPGFLGALAVLLLAQIAIALAVRAGVRGRIARWWLGVA